MERPMNPQAEEKLRIMDSRGIPLVVCGSTRWRRASRPRTARIPPDQRTEASAEASDSGGDYVSDENVAGLQAGRAGSSGVARIRQRGVGAR